MSNAVVARRFVISAALTFLQCLSAARAGSFVPIQWERVSSSNPLALLTYRAVQDPVLARIAAPVTAAPPYTILTPPNRIIRDFSMRLGFPFPNTYGAGSATHGGIPHASALLVTGHCRVFSALRQLSSYRHFEAQVQRMKIFFSNY